ncbi:BTAD domain-containing putative transcriptional regulator [Streptomyces sp. NPDC087440]|uniref:AfsR/SARP family transcriptional regulator n=1 Tax=Streptomyces sp. NPDC087440 TaxID=3365790 RepID=UPI0037F193A1
MGTAHTDAGTSAPPPLLRLHLFDGFRAVRDGGPPLPERWPRPGARTLVKLLALSPGHSLHREQAMAICWPDADQHSATGSLRVALHAARRALEPELAPRAASSYLVGDGALLRLDPRAVWIDADHAEAVAEGALAGGGASELAAALEAFAGELLPEDRYAPWSFARRERLAALHEWVRLALAEGRLAEGDAEAALAAVGPVLAASPAEERAHQVVIAAYSRLGLHRKAVRQYHLCREALDAELGVRPGARTEELHRAALGEGTGPGTTATPGGPTAPTAPVGLYANDTADRYYRDLVARLDLDAARARLAHSHVLRRMGHFAQAADVLREALAEFGQRGMRDDEVLAAAQLAEALVKTRSPQAALDVLAAYPPSDTTASEPAAAHHLARSVIFFVLGRYEEACAAADHAHRVAGAVAGVPGLGLVARALAMRASSLGLAGRFAEAKEAADRALAPAEAYGDPTVLAGVVSVRRENARRGGRLREAAAAGRRALVLAEQCGDPTAAAFERANLAEICLLLGEADEAQALAAAAVRGAETDGEWSLPYALVALARVRTGAGDADAAGALLVRAEGAAGDGGDRQARHEVRLARAELALSVRDFEGALLVLAEEGAPGSGVLAARAHLGAGRPVVAARLAEAEMSRAGRSGEAWTEAEARAVLRAAAALPAPTECSSRPG